MATKRRVNLNVADDVHEILVQVSARTGRPKVGQRRGANTMSASRYVESLVRDAQLEWRSAVAHLEASAWTRDAIALACDALEQHVGVQPQPARVLAEHLGALSSAPAALGIEMWHWKRLVDTIREPGNAGALYTVAREWWRHNPFLRQSLEPVAVAA